MKTFLIPPHWLERRLTVVVAGAGGTGSQVIDQLASLDSTLQALGHPGFDVSLHDRDTVSRWNLGRQRFCQPDVGLPKATVLIHRINQFYGVHYKAVPNHLMVQAAGNCDLLLSCTDSAAFRLSVAKYYKQRRTRALWMDFGNGSASAQCVMGHLSGVGTDRLPHVADLFGDLSPALDQDDAPSCSMQEALSRQPWPANRVVAIAGMTLIERLMRQGQVSTHGSVMQLDPYSVQPLAIDPVAWAMFGYTRSLRRRAKRASPLVA